MLINISNHPSTLWGEEQKAAAKRLGGEWTTCCKSTPTVYEEGFGDVLTCPTCGKVEPEVEPAIKDCKFPHVPPEFGYEEVEHLADRVFEELKEASGILDGTPVHLAGEPSLVLALAARLKEAGAEVYTATTRRDAIEEGGVKTSVFKFVRFRLLK